MSIKIQYKDTENQIQVEETFHDIKEFNSKLKVVEL